ncbi:hypothetical protein CALCODRAFT_215571 [Calocera cornea HHB12733]|uniref:Uncharacterized protein n=1 Tax=Calocera cornea HHB12733 TaxID=1353952 RepID=A0A165HBZ7_9BASI|nr:hypothetical protein CALCODRAFT_215571 [Calocera cornea HHB12733]
MQAADPGGQMGRWGRCPCRCGRRQASGTSVVSHPQGSGTRARSRSSRPGAGLAARVAHAGAAGLRFSRWEGGFGAMWPLGFSAAPGPSPPPGALARGAGWALLPPAKVNNEIILRIPMRPDHCAQSFAQGPSPVCPRSGAAFRSWWRCRSMLCHSVRRRHLEEEDPDD